MNLSKTIMIAFAVALGCVAESTAEQVPQQQQGTPIEQALSARLWNEISINVQCNAAVIGAAKQIQELQEKIKSLEANLKPAPAEKK